MSRESLGKARATGVSIHHRSPRAGEMFVTPLEDTFDGIRFEVGRMVEAVRDARSDPLVVDTARYVAYLSAKTAVELGESLDDEGARRRIFLEGILDFCRYAYFYVNDPANVEFFQTPGRMIRQWKTPPEVLEFVWAPIRDGMAARRNVDPASLTLPEGAAIGDCEEGVCLALAICVALEIVPVKFRFGGNDGTLHHVWGSVDGLDFDVTQPQLALGECLPFDEYDEYEVPL